MAKGLHLSITIPSAGWLRGPIHACLKVLHPPPRMEVEESSEAASAVTNQVGFCVSCLNLGATSIRSKYPLPNSIPILANIISTHAHCSPMQYFMYLFALVAMIERASQLVHFLSHSSSDGCGVPPPNCWMKAIKTPVQPCANLTNARSRKYTCQHSPCIVDVLTLPPWFSRAAGQKTCATRPWYFALWYFWRCF